MYPLKPLKLINWIWFHFFLKDIFIEVNQTEYTHINNKHNKKENIAEDVKGEKAYCNEVLDSKKEQS